MSAQNRNLTAGSSFVGPSPSDTKVATNPDTATIPPAESNEFAQDANDQEDVCQNKEKENRKRREENIQSKIKKFTAEQMLEFSKHLLAVHVQQQFDLWKPGCNLSLPPQAFSTVFNVDTSIPSFIFDLVHEEDDADQINNGKSSDMRANELSSNTPTESANTPTQEKRQDSQDATKGRQSPSPPPLTIFTDTARTSREPSIRVSTTIQPSKTRRPGKKISNEEPVTYANPTTKSDILYLLVKGVHLTRFAQHERHGEGWKCLGTHEIDAEDHWVAKEVPCNIYCDTQDNLDRHVKRVHFCMGRDMGKDEIGSAEGKEKKKEKLNVSEWIRRCGFESGSIPRTIKRNLTIIDWKKQAKYPKLPPYQDSSDTPNTDLDPSSSPVVEDTSSTSGGHDIGRFPSLETGSAELLKGKRQRCENLEEGVQSTTKRRRKETDK